jgi:hypothetical protein
MSKTYKGILKDLQEFEKSPLNIGYDFRLDLADIILRRLGKLKWSQAKLASVIGIHPPMLTKIMHSASNCTFETAGKILFALGVREAHIVQDAPHSVRSRGSNGSAKSTARGKQDQDGFG